MGPKSQEDGPPPGHNSQPRAESLYPVLSLCALLVLAVVLVFGQTVRHDFVAYDDGPYVFENTHVQGGLTTQGIAWVFTHSHVGNWHPLTGISHMLDCQFYGLSAGGHHATSVLLHAANTIVLLLVLLRMTGGLAPSAVVAALFAIHPLHVESVAWVAERKDVLSGLFFLLTLAAYVGYVRRPFSLARYLAVMLLFALGLMSKPMLVTLPFVLLLLDYWPLGRLVRRPTSGAATESSPPSDSYWLAWRPLVEKIPLVLLAGASCVATLMAQQEALIANEHMRLPWRVANALVSYVAYLGQFFYPVGLAALYPHPGNRLPTWEIVGASLVLVGISATALAARRKYPYLLVGWLWYLGMLVPVIGLVPVGCQAMADRYTYLPHIGLVVLLAWAAVDLAARCGCRRWAYGAVLTAVLAALMGVAWRQTSTWCNSETLWTRALACTSGNFIAHLGFGRTLEERRRVDEAVEQYRKALELNPTYMEAYSNLGNALRQQGRLDEAMAYCRKALEIQPQSVKTHRVLGLALAASGRFDEAIAQFQEALAIEPECAEAHNDLGAALLERGRNDEAIAHWKQAVAINPQDAQTHRNLGIVLYQQGKIAEALAQWTECIRLCPNDTSLMSATAWVLATCPEASLRNAARAVELAQQAAGLSGLSEPAVLDTLAAAYAEAGRYPEAIRTAEQALAIATAQHNATLQEAIRARIRLYQAGAPYRETTGRNR